MVEENDEIMIEDTAIPVDDLSDKITRISQNEKLRKSIASKGRKKYLKYFNSTLVADYIIKKTFELKNSDKFFWDKK